MYPLVVSQEAYRRPQDVQNGQVMVSKLVIPWTLAAHRMDVLRTSVGPKMVALSSKKVFSKNV